MNSKRIRPGMYRVTTIEGDEYIVTDVEFDDTWWWTVQASGELTSDPDLGLFRTKAQAMAALKEVAR
jgi:hypothetical protein